MKNTVLKKISIHSIIIIAIIMIVELFICNYKHYLIMPKGNDTFMAEELNLADFTYNEDGDYYEAKKNNPVIEIKDINYEVKTIYFDANPVEASKYKLDVTIYYTDETRLNYVSYGKKLEIITDYAQSRYIQEDFFGSSEKLKFAVNINKGDKIYFKEIALNKRIPLHLSLSRITSMFVLSFMIYGFVMLFHYRKEVKNNKKLNIAFKVSLSVLSFILVILIYGVGFNGFANMPFQDSGTQISQELVDAFLNGQVSLLAKPSAELLAVKDPYVPANRVGVSYLWDHVLFDGKYYSYYGITPVFLLFLPMKLLTGKYFYDGYAVIIFSSISIIFLSLAYYKLIKKKYPNLPLYIQLAGYIILFMSCGILSNIIRPAFYEVSTSCAFMCMTLTLFHLVNSNVLVKGEKVSYYHLTFASFWLALAVLSRATFALYAICGVIIFVIYFIQNRKEMDKKAISKYFVSSLLPLCIFGLIQCAYNYARFKSIFEFGIQYSLTINDFTKTKFHFSLAFTSLYNFLFATFSITDKMYFIKPNALTFGASGYYFFETTDAIGLFNRVPLLYMIFALPFMKTKMDKKEKLIFTLKYILPCVIIPIIIVMVTWESGFAIRYYSDFAPLMLLFVLFIFFDYYMKKEEENDLTSIKYYSIFFAATTLLSFTTSMAIMNCFVPNFGRHIGVVNYKYTYRYYRIARELAFWN